MTMAVRGNRFVDSSAYLNIILAKYAKSFDIYKQHMINGKQYAAYAYFSSLGEKYVLLKKAKLWSVKAFEHVFFLEEDSCTPELLHELLESVTAYMEPVLVRKGEKYPEKDHMYTYLTFAVLCRQTPDEEAKKAIRSFRFDKGYLFSMRGHSEVRLVVADLNGKEVLTNPAGRSLRKMYVKAFAETEQGARGYNELFDPPEQR